jgi:hypothetical protein
MFETMSKEKTAVVTGVAGLLPSRFDTQGSAAPEKNSQVTTARKVAMKMGRRLRIARFSSTTANS